MKVGFWVSAEAVLSQFRANQAMRHSAIMHMAWINQYDPTQPHKLEILGLGLVR
jgi:hypothetical protein